MKKINILMIAIAFTLTFGTAYAAELNNGITDFTGRSYDTFDIGNGAMIGSSVEGVSAGGLREDTSMKELSNGVTDFSGRTYDSFGIAGADLESVEGTHAGGLRKDDSAVQPYNAITDFAGRTYDTLDIGS